MLTVKEIEGKKRLCQHITRESWHPWMSTNLDTCYQKIVINYNDNPGSEKKYSALQVGKWAPHSNTNDSLLLLPLLLQSPLQLPSPSSLFLPTPYKNFKETSPGNEREGRGILLLQDCVQGVRELLQAPQPPSCMQEFHGMRESLSLSLSLSTIHHGSFSLEE